LAKKLTSGKPTWLDVREIWQETSANLSEVFVRLNWGHADVPQFSLSTNDGETFDVRPVASLKNFHVLQIHTPVTISKSRLRNVHREVLKKYPDNVLIVRDSSTVRIEWPRRKLNGDVKYDTFLTSLEQPHQLIFQKLAGAGFEISELSRVTLEDVRARIYGLSSESVTKRFYEQFRDEHEKLAASITAKAELGNLERHSYSSLLLNRLMFIYFLQKKEFLSDDPNLLNNVLMKCDETGANFYNEALLPLFFEGFNGQEAKFKSRKLDDWWGTIPYINGGIFAPHDLEDKAALKIPNLVFTRVFEFFEKFDWHLDSRPIGTSNEINPEVLGYIFEQYINYTADGKKESGAYYTPEDVTGYMVAQTLIPRVLDEFVRVRPGCLNLVKQNPTDYIQRSLFHGATSSAPLVWRDTPKDLLAIWEGDPIGWHVLDETDTNPEIVLPGETWVEMFYRRSRLSSLIDNLSRSGIEQVSDIVTLNLNGSKLISDLTTQIEDRQSIHEIWDAVSDLSVIDPTCGSGAFLFAALTAMEPIYEELLDALGEDAHHIGEQFARGNVKYQIRKHIAMRNLYGTDIMADAIETAKLRIFLALAAVLEHPFELEPLPDLDFNLKAGNLVIGLYDILDASRINSDQMIDGFYDFDEIERQTKAFQELFRKFKDAELRDIQNVSSLKAQLIKTQSELRELTNKKFIEIVGEGNRDDVTWLKETKAFHWFAEFPEIVERGGFDVIIGNPPYIRTSGMDQDSRDAIATYKSKKVPDFYATCFERSIQILADTGRHSLIVMLNLAHSDQYAALREVIARRGFSEWWSTYGKWPTQLFKGVRVANTLLVLGPGTEKHATRHHIFGSEVRAHLFNGIEYFPFERSGAEKPIRGGLIGNLFREIIAREVPAEAISDQYLYLRPTAQYWFPLLFGIPPVLNASGDVLKAVDAGAIPLRLSSSENRLITGATLAGKIGYGWWSSIGDDFNVVARQADVPRLFARNATVTEELQVLAEAVMEERRRAAFVSKNNDGYINVRWSAVRKTTDFFDRALLDSIGLGAYWRPLNVWYRQSMRSGRDNHNSRYLTPEEVDRFLSW
jgi:hypothetical protein